MEWKVPISDIDFDGREAEAVQKVLDSKWLSSGEVTSQFEVEFAKLASAKYACAVSSCTAALHLACHILNVKTGDEVILPSLTFVATANAVVYCGGTPVFADVISDKNLLISPEAVKEKITPRTKGIIVVHYGGYCCDVDIFEEMAREKGLFIIEDAAHAPGASFRKRHAGTCGDFGCFSFFPNKNITTGEGGMLITNNERLAEKMKPSRSHGLTTMTWDRHRGHAHTYDVPAFGFNYRIDEIRSAIGLAQLRKLERLNRARANLVALYAESLGNVRNVVIPFKERISPTRGDTPSYHLFPILVRDEKERDELMKFLKENGVQTSIHYPPVHLFTYYRGRFGTKEGMLPITENVSKRLITLPLYGTMSGEKLEYVCNLIKGFFGAR